MEGSRVILSNFRTCCNRSAVCRLAGIDACFPQNAAAYTIQWHKTGISIGAGMVGKGKGISSDSRRRFTFPPFALPQHPKTPLHGVAWHNFLSRFPLFHFLCFFGDYRWCVLDGSGFFSFLTGILDATVQGGDFRVDDAILNDL